MDFGNDLDKYIPWISTAALAAYAIYVTLKLKDNKKDGLVNQDVSKDQAKVVHSFNTDDLEVKKTAFCRCWRSKKFPYCDGSHTPHNDQTGDNVGPLVIDKKAA